MRMIDKDTYVDDNEHEKYMQEDEHVNQDQLLNELIHEIHSDDEKLPPRVFK